MEEQIARVISEYQLDLFRLDWNVDARQMRQCEVREGYIENTASRYNENLYRVYENLRSRFPEVIFENCAGGGGRTDLGMMEHFDFTWVSDWQIAPRSFVITNGMTMALPPERINRLMGGQKAYTTAEFAFQIRNLIFSQQNIGGICPPYADQHPGQLECLRHHVDIYKNFIRPMFARSNIYHHTPELTKESSFGILELAQENGEKAVVGVFRLRMSQENSAAVCLRGLDAGKMYRVTFDNTGAAVDISGYELMYRGLNVFLPGVLTSELLLLSAVNDTVGQ